jgi:hypothetical protein
MCEGPAELTAGESRVSDLWARSSTSEFRSTFTKRVPGRTILEPEVSADFATPNLLVTQAHFD